MIEVFVDMDGVLADFDKAKRDHKLPTNDEDMWRIINEKHENWFLNLDPMPGYKDLWNVAVDLDMNNDPIVLTATSAKRPYRATWQKQYWLAKHLGGTMPPTIVCLRSHKKDWSARSRVLIDDNEQTINEWIGKGGIGVLYEDHKQAIEELIVIKELYETRNNL